MSKNDRHEQFHYPNRSMRIDDKTWKKLNSWRKELGLGWNKFMEFLIEKYDK